MVPPRHHRRLSRNNATDDVLPAEFATGWNVAAGALDPNRDLLADFQKAGFAYTANATQLKALPSSTEKLLGLYALSNMNVASDKIDGRRGNPAVVNEFGFPDQPMLDEMTDAALAVLSKNPAGFVLMVEAASSDKQAHNRDTDRWILETIEFDRAIGRAKAFAAANPDTLVLVTADHECAGVNIIGASTVTQARLNARANSGGGAAQLRDPAPRLRDTRRRCLRTRRLPRVWDRARQPPRHHQSRPENAHRLRRRRRPPPRLAE